jgi:hypothetical protein
MSEVAAYLAHLDQFVIVTSCLALAGLLVWLIGLLVVLRGSKPGERPAIILAYAVCRPFVLRRIGCHTADPQQEEGDRLRSVQPSPQAIAVSGMWRIERIAT